MSEASEFLVFLSALRDTPDRLDDLGTVPRHVWEELIVGEVVALARLNVLLSAERPTELPETAGAPPSWADDPAGTFRDLRGRVLTLLDGVGPQTLRRSARLRSGKPLDPWSLAGELAQRDVATLARLKNR